MIIRVFRTKVRPGTHQQYEALIRQRVVPLMLEAPGLLSLHVGLPLDDPPDEFLEGGFEGHVHGPTSVRSL